MCLFGIELELAADDRHVGVGREARGLDPNAKVGTVRAARAPRESDGEERADLRAEGGVLGGSAVHRPDLSREVIELDPALRVGPNVLVEGEAVMRGVRHGPPSLPPGSASAYEVVPSRSVAA